MGYYVRRRNGELVSFDDETPRQEAMQRVRQMDDPESVNESFLGDLGDAFSGLGVQGLASAAGGIMDMLPMGLGQRVASEFTGVDSMGQQVAQSGRDFANRELESVSPETARDMNQEGLAAINPRNLAMQGVGSVPSMVPTLGAGWGARAAGATPEVAAGISAAMEGAQGAGSVADSIEEGVRDIAAYDPDTFTNSEYGQQALRDTNGNYAQAVELAAQRAKGLAPLAAGAITGAVGRFVGINPTTIAGRRALAAAVLRGALSEAGEEAIQSANETAAANIDIRNVDPNRSVFEGVPAASVTGALTAAPMGGAFGVLEGMHTAANPVTAPPPPPPGLPPPVGGSTPPPGGSNPGAASAASADNVQDAEFSELGENLLPAPPRGLPAPSPEPVAAQEDQHGLMRSVPETDSTPEQAVNDILSAAQESGLAGDDAPAAPAGVRRRFEPVPLFRAPALNSASEEETQQAYEDALVEAGYPVTPETLSAYAKFAQGLYPEPVFEGQGPDGFGLRVIDTLPDGSEVPAGVIRTDASSLKEAQALAGLKSADDTSSAQPSPAAAPSVPELPAASIDGKPGRRTVAISKGKAEPLLGRREGMGSLSYAKLAGSGDVEVTTDPGAGRIEIVATDKSKPKNVREALSILQAAVRDGLKPAVTIATAETPQGVVYDKHDQALAALNSLTQRAKPSTRSDNDSNQKAQAAPEEVTAPSDDGKSQNAAPQGKIEAVRSNPSRFRSDLVQAAATDEVQLERLLAEMPTAAQKTAIRRFGGRNVFGAKKEQTTAILRALVKSRAAKGIPASGAPMDVQPMAGPRRPTTAVEAKGDAKLDPRSENLIKEFREKGEVGLRRKLASMNVLALKAAHKRLGGVNKRDEKAPAVIERIVSRVKQARPQPGRGLPKPNTAPNANISDVSEDIDVSEESEKDDTPERAESPKVAGVPREQFREESGDRIKAAQEKIEQRRSAEEPAAEQKGDGRTLQELKAELKRLDALNDSDPDAYEAARYDTMFTPEEIALVEGATQAGDKEAWNLRDVLGDFKKRKKGLRPSPQQERAKPTPAQNKERSAAQQRAAREKTDAYLAYSIAKNTADPARAEQEARNYAARERAKGPAAERKWTYAREEALVDRIRKHYAGDIPRPMESRKRDLDQNMLFSQALRQAKLFPQDKSTRIHMVRWLEKRARKPELEMLDLNQFLEPGEREQATKEEFVKWIDDRRVRLETKFFSRPEKFGMGGNSGLNTESEYRTDIEDFKDFSGVETANYQNYTLRGSGTPMVGYEENAVVLKNKPGKDIDVAHFGGPGTIAHWRKSDLPINGKKAYHIEEVQSDYFDAPDAAFGEGIEGWKAERNKLIEELGKYPGMRVTDYRGVYDYKDSDRISFRIRDNGEYFLAAPEDLVDGNIPAIAALNISDADKKRLQRIGDLDSDISNYIDNIGDDERDSRTPYRKDWPQVTFRMAFMRALAGDYDIVSWNSAEAVRSIQGMGSYKGNLYDEALPKYAQGWLKPYGVEIKEASVTTPARKRNLEEDYRNAVQLASQEINDGGIDSSWIVNAMTSAAAGYGRAESLPMSFDLTDDVFERTGRNPTEKQKTYATRLAKRAVEKMRQAHADPTKASVPIHYFEITDAMREHFLNEGAAMFKKGFKPPRKGKAKDAPLDPKWSQEMQEAIKAAAACAASQMAAAPISAITMGAGEGAAADVAFGQAFGLALGLPAALTINDLTARHRNEWPRLPPREVGHVPLNSVILDDEGYVDESAAPFIDEPPPFEGLYKPNMRATEGDLYPDPALVPLPKPEEIGKGE